MKRILYILLTLAVFSCKTEAPVPFSLSESERTMPADGGTFTIDVSCGGDYDMDIPQGSTWSRLVKSPTSVKFEVDPNATYGARTAKYTFRCGSTAIPFTLRQEQNDAIISDKDKLEVGAGHVVLKLSVKSNVNYSCESDADWIVPVKGKALTADIQEIEILDNFEESVRSGAVYLKYGSISKKIEIEQSAFAFSINCPEELSSSEVDYNVQIQSNISDAFWTLSCDSQWLSFSNTEGRGNADILMHAEAHDGADARTAKIVITIGGKPVEVSIVQNPAATSLTSIDIPGIYRITDNDVKEIMTYRRGVDQYAYGTASSISQFRIQNYRESWAVCLSFPSGIREGMMVNMDIKSTGLDIPSESRSVCVEKLDKEKVWMIDRENNIGYVAVIE